MKGDCLETPGSSNKQNFWISIILGPYPRLPIPISVLFYRKSPVAEDTFPLVFIINLHKIFSERVLWVKDIMAHFLLDILRIPRSYFKLNSTFFEKRRSSFLRPGKEQRTQGETGM